MYHTTPHYGYGLDPSAWGTSAFFTMCARRSGSGEECHFFPCRKGEHGIRMEMKRTGMARFTKMGVSFGEAYTCIRTFNLFGRSRIHALGLREKKKGRAEQGYLVVLVMSLKRQCDVT